MIKTLLATVAIALIAGLLPTAAIGAASRTLVLAIALMAAGIFPCMTLVVNAMKGEGRSPSMVKDLYEKLEKLLKVLVVAFVLAVLSVLSLVATSSAIEVAANFWLIKTSAVLSGSALGLFMGRVAAIGQAFFALLEINRKQALLIARGEVRNNRDQSMDESRQERLRADDNKISKFRKAG